MTVSINHVAAQSVEQSDGAKSAQSLVVESSSIIEQTIRDIHQISQVVTVSAGSIHEMETHSGEVATVINVIRDIADQTNLLALNAAIEAAGWRAGPGLCRGGRRGAQAGGTHHQIHPGNFLHH
jgi:methyl-accepting chemotaxis protein